jgi:SAM-dependent methyltransferase
MQLVARPCPICGSADDTRLFAEATFDPAQLDDYAFASRKLPDYMHHRLVVCGRCDLLYASPVPSRADLAHAYGAAAFDSGPEARFAARTYAELLSSVLPRLPDRDGALDVGAGDGAFLEELVDAGFTGVTGVEPSAAPVAAAKPAVQPLIRLGAFRAGDVANASVRLITCFQTMEHLFDPLETCREFHRLLKAGGAVMLVAHDRLALSARIMGRRSPIFDHEHLQLFSPASARRLLEAAGFADVQIHRVANRYPLRYWARLSPLPDRIRRSVIRCLDALAIGGVPIRLPAGNIAAIGFR